MSGERDVPLSRSSRDREVRLGRELAVHLHEVDAELDERVDAGAAFVGVAREDVRDRDVAALEVRTRGDDARADERAGSNLAAPRA